MKGLWSNAALSTDIVCASTPYAQNVSRITFDHRQRYGWRKNNARPTLRKDSLTYSANSAADVTKGETAMRTSLSKEERTEQSFETTTNGLIRCEDGLLRPEWAAAPGLLRDYYDTEWGVPTHDEREIFERLCLEAFQAGLSWLTILKRRDAFREAFAHFDPDAVASFSDADLERLAHNPSIIRNRRKIEAARTNARATLHLRESTDLPDLPALLWSYAPENPQRPRSISELRPTSPESIACSKELKKHGFAFVGPTTVMSTLEAIGVLDRHIEGAYSPVTA